MRLKSFKIGKTAKNPEEETGREATVTATEVAGMEEKIYEKTRKLRHAEKQLKGLTSSARIAGENEGEIPAPHGPLIELTVEPDNILLDLDIEKKLFLTGKNKRPAATARHNDDGHGNTINSLPEVSARELINALEEIKGIIRERRSGP